MKKKLLLTGITLFSFLNLANAQAYDWVTGGGSTELMTPSRNWERVTNMCTDDDGNVYITAVTGSSSILADTFFLASASNTYPSIQHILLAGYNCDGGMRWAKLIEASEWASMGSDYYNGSMICTNGSLYLVGTMIGTNKHIGHDTTITSTYLETFISRFDTLGRFKWIRFLGIDSEENEFVTGFGDNSAVAVDGQGFIHFFNFMDSGAHLTPTFTSLTGTYDLKYDSTGTLISETKMPWDTTWTLAKVIYNKQNGKFYALLGNNGLYPYDYYNTAVCAFGPDDYLLWLDSTSNGKQITSFDYKGGNEIYLSGYGNYPDTFRLGGLAAADTIFPLRNIAIVARLDTNGVAKWIYNLQSNEGFDAFTDITILPDGKIAATGQGGAIAIHGVDTIRTVSYDYSNPFLLIVDSAGHTIKLGQAYGDGYDYGTAIASDAVGNVYVGGNDADSIGATSLSPYLSHGGNTDFFLLKYGYDCSCTSAPAAAFTYTGTATVTFTYTGTTCDSLKWTFGDGDSSTLTNPAHTYSTRGTHQVCVTVYTSCGSDKYCYDINSATGIATAAMMGNVLAYPNPVADDLVIAHASITSTLMIFNIEGQEVYSCIVTSDHQEISMQNFVPGAYLLQITDIYGNRILRTVVKE